MNPTALDLIAARLKATRDALGMTQTELCRRSGIATNTYNQWEAAKGRPRLDEAIKLVRAFGLTLDWIYLGNITGVRHDLATLIDDPHTNQNAPQERISRLVDRRDSR